MKYYAVERTGSLSHYGRLGMKWYQHIYGKFYDNARYATRKAETNKENVKTQSGSLHSVKKTNNSEDKSLDSMKEKGSNKSFKEIKASVNSIAKYVDKFRGDSPAGNQNCQVCTWAMECQFRGMNILPRPVFSPRDPVLEMNGTDIVKGAKIESISNKADVISKVKNAGDGARFYTHVKWNGGSGGHEFITTNIKGKVYVIDAQHGVVDTINSENGKSYFGDINYSKSFIARMDNKELNTKTLEMNDHKNVVKWDWPKDIQYMKENNMLSDEDLEDAKKYL